MGKLKFFLIKELTPSPVEGEIIKPNIKGKVIATWSQGKDMYSTYIIINNDKKLVAVTDINFNPNNHIQIPLVCHLDMKPESPDECIQIIRIGNKYAKGQVGYLEE
jgi:hypothetical protein